MKKVALLGVIVTIMVTVSPTKAQPVSDNAVIPVAVTLNRIMRLKIVNGGNIEFVFNSIQDYTAGIANSTFYDSQIRVAASSNWQIVFGAEDGTTMYGTDNSSNTIRTDNIGFIIDELGTNTEGVEITDDYLAIGAAAPVSLPAYPTTLMSAAGTGTASNAGYETENDWRINWQCGTAAGGMYATPFIDQDEDPDRYVTNVIFTLEDD